MRYTNLILVLSLMFNGFLLCWLFFVDNGSGAERPDKEIVKVIDTVHTIREIRTEKILPGKIVKQEKIDTLFLRDTLRIQPDELATRRIYSDTITQDSARLYYRHSIIGALEHSEYSFFIPERKITEIRERTIREVVRPTWQVFGGLQLQNNRLSYGGAIYKRGIGLQYYYEPGTKSHRVGVGVRLVSW